MWGAAKPHQHWEGNTFKGWIYQGMGNCLSNTRYGWDDHHNSIRKYQSWIQLYEKWHQWGKSSWRARVVYLRRDWGGGREVQGQKKGGPRNNEGDKMHKWRRYLSGRSVPSHNSLQLSLNQDKWLSNHNPNVVLWPCHPCQAYFCHQGRGEQGVSIAVLVCVRF